jgi:hypothetical protein
MVCEQQIVKLKQPALKLVDLVSAEMVFIIKNVLSKVVDVCQNGLTVK